MKTLCNEEYYKFSYHDKRYRENKKKLQEFLKLSNIE
jgi:hypothetical protein